MNLPFIVVGGMAGSSMDGLDLALVEFTKRNGGWDYSIIHGETLVYDQKLEDNLKHAASLDEKDLKILDIEFGRWIGNQINFFMAKHKVKADLLAIHGHTAIHNPRQGISWQLGHGKLIANVTGVTTITDFRSLDIEYGGQGAPLVPMGDFDLFKEYDACLNLGGIANISVYKRKSAWDICPCNQVLNYYAKKLEHSFDEDGRLARGGTMDHQFLQKLQVIDYFSQRPPKSLPNQFISKSLLDSVSPQDGLRTYTEFIANQVSVDLKREHGESGNASILVSGGGAFNEYLLELLGAHLKEWKIVVPEKEIVIFKEAIIFAYLGLLKYIGEDNVLCSVTGARQDTSSGEIHLPNELNLCIPK